MTPTRYVPHSAGDVEEMLAAVRASSVDDLFAEIPEAVRRREPLALPAGLSEAEVVAELRRLAGKDVPATQLVSFLGAGVYDHYVPAVVEAVVSRGEFLTAYTPYQPERSQGVLQTIFEFQTAICELTGMDVSNASMYDGGTALAEASFLAGVQTRRGEVVLSAGVHPEYRQVLATESAGYGPRPQTVGLHAGAATDLDALAAAIGDDTAAVVVQQPNFFGALEDLPAVAELAHAAGALVVVVADPVSLGLLEAPGRLGADIVVGEAQALGNAMNFGGPGIGYMAVTTKLMRRIPGRLVGETVDLEGRRGFVLTLQTREQHIRREKATSNICSNHALNALATLVYLSWLGKEGLPELGLHCARKAAYLRERLLALPGVAAFTEGPVFREFAVRLPRPAAAVVEALVPEGFLAGVPASRFAGLFDGDPLDDVLLVAVTEKRTRAELDAFVDALRPRPRERGGGPWLTAATRPSAARPTWTARPSTRSRAPAGARTRCRSSACPRCPPPSSSPSLSAAPRRRACPRSARSTCCVTSPGLSTLNYGVDSGSYPLGSCTMKYNPRVNEVAARLDGFAGLHPYQPESLVQGALELMYELERWLAEISGLHVTTLQPAAGAHGELTGLLIIRAAHLAEGRDPKRIIIPDTAHGTNPASVVMGGFVPAPVRSDARGGVDLDHLREVIAERRHRRPHAHQPQHARPVRRAHRRDRHASCTRPAACSTTTAPTPTPCSASAGPATWASTSSTSTRTRRSARRTAAAVPAPDPSWSATRWRRSCRCRWWRRPRTVASSSSTTVPSPSARCAPSTATSACWCAPGRTSAASARKGCARSARRRCSTPTT